MEYPNKIYTLEFTVNSTFNTMKAHYVIVVAASSIELAKMHVKEQIGYETEPTWLMGAAYPTIYNSFGNEPLKEQVKILYNGSFRTDM